MLLARAEALEAPAPRLMPPVQGLVGISSGGQLERVLANGTQIPLGPRLSGLVLADQLSCLDEARGVYYVVGCDDAQERSVLVGISLVNGTELSRTVLPFAPQPFIGAGQSLTWDPRSSRAIVGGQIQDGGVHVVGWVNASQGSFSVVASLPATLLDMPGGGQSAYNPMTGLLVLQLASRSGEPVLAAVNMTDAKVKRAAPLNVWPLQPDSVHFCCCAARYTSGQRIRPLAVTS